MQLVGSCMQFRQWMRSEEALEGWICAFRGKEQKPATFREGRRRTKAVLRLAASMPSRRARSSSWRFFHVLLNTQGAIKFRFVQNVP